MSALTPILDAELEEAVSRLGLVRWSPASNPTPDRLTGERGWERVAGPMYMWALRLDRLVIRSCRMCGCTDDDCSGCVERTGWPCSWVGEDLCSACADELAAAPGRAVRVLEVLLEASPGSVMHTVVEVLGGARELRDLRRLLEELSRELARGETS